MRILELHLTAFGPFTDSSLDLSKNDDGMHIIYGPNEAGKSASLRALTALFYGIPVRTADNFLHDNQNLRIAALIRHSDGEELYFVRRKGRKDTLLNRAGQPIPESSLNKYLNGAEEEFFSTMFGLDHEVLIRGGEQILRGGGAIGESLFAAGMGRTNVREVMKGLEEEAAKLFLPRGKTQLIPTSLSAYRDAKQAVQRASLSSREWAEHDQALRRALSEKERLEKEIREIEKEKNRLQRWQKALPRIAERKELESKLRALGEIKILPATFSKKRREAVQNLDRARDTERVTAEALTRIIEKTETLTIPKRLLQEAEIVTHLVERLGSHRKAFKDLPRLQGEKIVLTSDAQNLLKDLKPHASFDEVESLRLSTAKRAGIRDLGNRHETLQERLRRAHQDVKKCEHKLDAKERELAAMQAPKSGGELRSVVAFALQEGKIEQELKKSIGELEAGKRQAQLELGKLGQWSGTLEELEAIPIPSAETINRFDYEFGELAKNLRSVQERIKQVHAIKSDLEVRLRELQLSGPVPTELDLENARKRRDQGWVLVRRAWLEGDDDSHAVQAFDAEYPLAIAYEKSVGKADRIADRLRREADRVAQMANLLSQSKRCDEDLTKGENEEIEAQAKITSLTEEWLELWRTINVTALTPAEMRAWVVKHDRLVQQSIKLREEHRRFDNLVGRVNEHRTALSNCLASLDEKPAKSDETLASLIFRGQTLIDRIDNTTRKYNLLREAIEELTGELLAAKQSLNSVEGEQTVWQEQWNAAVKDLGMSGKASPVEATAVLDKVEEMVKKVDKIVGLEHRIDGIFRDGEEFEKDVAKVVERVAPDLGAIPSEQAVSELHKRLQDALTDSATLSELQNQRKEKEEVIRKAGDVIGESEMRLKELCREANCREYGELEEIEERSLKAQRLMEELKSLERQLLDYSGGSSLDELIEEVESVNADALPAQIATLIQQSEEMEAMRADLLENIGREKTQLSLMDGSAEAAEAAERAQSILADIRDYASRYIRLKLASTVLSREIERYRAENQDPLLRRAQELFSQLTLQSFVGLQPDFNEMDEPILLGVRATTERVGVQGMSDGSRDQLFLALRLASLERYLDHNEPMPLIVDDILINFDDQRAEATLKVLAELAERTQVIFFTHHVHLLELVRASALPHQVLRLGS